MPKTTSWTPDDIDAAAKDPPPDPIPPKRTKFPPQQLPPGAEPSRVGRTEPPSIDLSPPAPSPDDGLTEMQRFVQNFKNNRVAFVETIFKIQPEPWQREALTALDEGITRVAIKSGHGVGKTAFLSWCIVHHLSTRYPQKTQVTAPTSGQLFDALAAETKRWLRTLPLPLQELFNAKSDRIELVSAPESSFVAFRTSRPDLPEALQGVHSSGGVLLIADEASGIPESVYQAAGGSLSGHKSIFLLAGNPTRPEGYFYDRFQKPDGKWHLQTVSGEDSNLVSDEYTTSVEEQYERDSNVYRVRVLGEFPTFDSTRLIKLDLLESAIKRDIEIDAHQRIVWGLDVARGAGDRTALVKRQGRVVTEVVTRRFNDLMSVVGWVKDEYRKAETTSPPATPYEIAIDAIGMGAGVADRATELGLPALAVNVAELASMSPEAYRLRDDLWIQVRNWLERKDVKLPDSKELLVDLQAPSYSFTSAGKLKVSSKEEMKRQGFKSPDAADALCLTFAGEGATALYGSQGPGSSWSRDLDIQEPAYV